MKRILLIVALIATACCQKAVQTAGTRAEALDDSAWECSEWISVVDAPVVTGKVGSNDNCRAADGASWFVSEPVNAKKVVGAKWMTAGLGVYYLYVNGKPVGKEVLKPGFTHFAKTKRGNTMIVQEQKGTSDAKEMYHLVKKTKIKPRWDFVKTVEAINSKYIEKTFEKELQKNIGSG